MAQVIKKQSIMSMRLRRARSQYSAEVARINPLRKALESENPMLRARRKMTRTPMIPARAEGSLAVKAVSPRRSMTAEAVQK